MDSNVEAALIGVAGAALLGLIGWVWILHERNVALARELLQFKLEAAEKYASIKYLKDVEGRLTETLDKLADVVDKLREAVSAARPFPGQH